MSGGARLNFTTSQVKLRSYRTTQTQQKLRLIFERALAVSHEQRAKSWELRAAISLARLRRDQGKRREAQDLLGVIFGWFTEGFIRSI